MTTGWRGRPVLAQHQKSAATFHATLRLWGRTMSFWPPVPPGVGRGWDGRSWRTGHPLDSRHCCWLSDIQIWTGIYQVYRYLSSVQVSIKVSITLWKGVPEIPCLFSKVFWTKLLKILGPTASQKFHISMHIFDLIVGKQLKSISKIEWKTCLKKAMFRRTTGYFQKSLRSAHILDFY